MTDLYGSQSETLLCKAGHNSSLFTLKKQNLHKVQMAILLNLTAVFLTAHKSKLILNTHAK